MSDTRERVTIYYDRIEDKDIHEWIESLPERSKTTFIQKAIRLYIQQDNSSPLANNENLEGIFKKIKELEERIEVLESSNANANRNSNEHQQNDTKYVDASHIIKDLGK